MLSVRERKVGGDWRNYLGKRNRNRGFERESIVWNWWVVGKIWWNGKVK